MPTSPTVGPPSRTAPTRTAVAAPAVDLKEGSRGPAVKQLQAALLQLKFSPGPTDGSFGPVTEQALRRFQASRKLTVDGLYGPKTRQALRAALSGAAPVASPPSVRGPYPQPLISTNTPDPSILKHGDTYYLVNTSGKARNLFKIRASKDLKTWHTVGPVFPRAPQWTAGKYWAPELHKAPGGKGFVFYYTAKERRTGRLTIGVATSDKVSGPWKDLGRPLLTKPGMGVIDPNYFQDTNGRAYLIYKDDGNAVRKKTPIWIQEVGAGGTKLVGEPKQLLTNDRAWEGAIIEGPEMHHRDGYYYLFYSGNAYWNDRYAVGVARSRSPLGPFEKHDTPILTSSKNFKGPGHSSPVITAPDGKEYLPYHAWRRGHDKFNPGPGRVLLMDQIRWVDGWPKINDGHPSG